MRGRPWFFHLLSFVDDLGSWIKNPFVWAFALLQCWACMARSISIETLSFHNFRLEEDAIMGRYDKHKTHQTGGDSAHDKHLYSNPFDPIVDLYLALGIWFALDNERFRDNESLFLTGETKEGTASHWFYSQLNEILDKNVVELFIYLHATRPCKLTFNQERRWYSFSVRENQSTFCSCNCRTWRVVTWRSIWLLSSSSGSWWCTPWAYPNRPWPPDWKLCITPTSFYSCQSNGQ